ncbi:MAG: phosphomannomutase/phosphoglucomutase [Clostridia bacterium]|nr:phosphomannomutase/phosphoglucomutase [Clostridia bacterium]
MNSYLSLKSGSDIRGTAVTTANSDIELTDEVVFKITVAFCKWLEEKGYNGKRIAVGHDSRISAERIKKQVINGLAQFDKEIYDCSFASTPAMFMTTVDAGCIASVQITASHHPYDKNGLKFFTADGGLNPEDIERILILAEMPFECKNTNPCIISADYMSVYAERLKNMIKEGVNSSENYDKPLEGFKIVVDAGNGVGGFYATDVLAPLGADITGSQFLDKDGMFPNHIPNPENKDAMKSVCNATVNNKADLGIIFDTDVDRAGCVDENGKEINRNRLVALASLIALENCKGGTIVTDSVTSTGLTDFICKELGGVHMRFRRGYRNVINKQLELEKSGVLCPLAMETSGHAAFKENFYLDDGAYLVTKIVIKMAQLGKEGKKLDSLISSLKEPAEALEIRFKINENDFKKYGLKVIEELEKYAESNDDWRIADDNYEGIRIYFDDEKTKGWLLLRLSVHDPIMPLNIESDVLGGNKRIAEKFYSFIKKYDKLDLSVIERILE